MKNKVVGFIEEKMRGGVKLIQDEMYRKRLVASGRAVNSLEVSESLPILSIKGSDYIEYLDRGRPPGKFPPMAAIERWVDSKGLQVDPYVIARGIARQGSRIYRNRSLGIELDKKNQAISEDIKRDLPTFMSNLIKTEVNKAFKK
jgi:hypothetical protein